MVIEAYTGVWVLIFGMNKGSVSKIECYYFW